MFDIRKSKLVSKPIIVVGIVLLLIALWTFFAVKQIDIQKSVVTEGMVYSRLFGSLIIIASGLFVDEKINRSIQDNLGIKLGNFLMGIIFLLLIILGIWLILQGQPSYVLY